MFCCHRHVGSQSKTNMKMATGALLPRCYKLRSEDDIVNERGPLPLTVHDGTRNRRCGFPTPSHHTAISNLGGEDFGSDDPFLTTS